MNRPVDVPGEPGRPRPRDDEQVVVTAGDGDLLAAWALRPSRGAGPRVAAAPVAEAGPDLQTGWW